MRKPLPPELKQGDFYTDGTSYYLLLKHVVRGNFHRRAHRRRVNGKIFVVRPTRIRTIGNGWKCCAANLLTGLPGNFFICNVLEFDLKKMRKKVKSRFTKKEKEMYDTVLAYITAMNV